MLCGSRVERIRLNAGVVEAAWHNCPGRNARPYCWPLHQPDATGREFPLSWPARAVRVEACQTSGCSLSYDIDRGTSFFFFFLSNLILCCSTPVTSAGTMPFMTSAERECSHAEKSSSFPLYSRAAQRCLQSAPELNVTMYAPHHPWIKPASGPSPQHRRFAMVSHVSFPCPQPSGIWIFISFKLGTNDTRRKSDW